MALRTIEVVLMDRDGHWDIDFFLRPHLTTWQNCSVVGNQYLDHKSN